MAVLLAFCGPAVAEDLDARAQALRNDLAAHGSQPSIRVSAERQLLISLERRRDLARARDEAVAAFEADDVTAPVEAPNGLLELDDIRREIQQLDLGLEAGSRRLEILHSDRAAAATRLTEAVARMRQSSDGQNAKADAQQQARVEAELAESTVAEHDLLGAIIELQQKTARRQREQLAARIAATHMPLQPRTEELDEIQHRMDARQARLEQAAADAAAAREAAHRDVDAQRAGAGVERRKTLTEQTNTRDVGIQLAREALSNLAIERTAWQLAMRYWRDGDATAIVEARQRGPAVIAMLQRRLDFVKASIDQLLARTGTLDAQIAQAPDAADAGEWNAQRAALDERLRLLQSAALDQRRVLDLLERMRGDFDARIDAASVADHLILLWATLRDGIARSWNFELFTVEQTVEVDGRPTSVPNGVTVAKVIKAPLLLLLGLFLALRLTALIERRVRKRGIDAGTARLVRRWTLGLLACACMLASLALAGIPFAAFAFVGGALAIGVGFGMQTLLKNLMSGLLVLIERPFRLGDEIQVGELRGTVVDIDLRASVVRDGDGTETLIPNSVLVDQNVRKVTTAQAKTIRQSLTLAVDADADPREVGEIMRAATHRHGLTHSREPHVFLDDASGDALHFTLQYWAELQPGGERKRVASDLRQMILGAFHSAGIRLARTVAAPAPVPASAAPRQRPILRRRPPLLLRRPAR